jgi:hypothetical protein
MAATTLTGPAVSIAPPTGLTGIIETFGDVHPYVAPDGSISPYWPEKILTTIKLPLTMRLSWDHKVSVYQLSCHHELKDVFSSVFEQIVRDGLAGKVLTFGGCYAFRSKRGAAQYSTHVWGIAIDLNPETNAMGTPGNMDPEIIRVFAEHGFEWGGHFLRKDPMHFQFCQGY